MKNIKGVLIGGLLLFMAGCVSTSGIILVKSNIGTIPGDTCTHKISAGEVLYSKFDYSSSQSAKVTGKFKIGILDQAIVTSDLILTDLGDKEAYCGQFDRYTPGQVNEWHGCFVDEDSDGRFEKLIYSGGSVSIKDRPKYIKGVLITEGFKREILFQGRTEKTVKFKYREFTENMARPAFTQDIEYFIENDGTTTGSFRGLTIDIVSIDGNYISYHLKGDIGM